MLQPHHLTLGERAFLEALQELVKQKASLVSGARVSFKRNAADDLVFAVIVPSAKLPPRDARTEEAGPREPLVLRAPARLLCVG